MATATTGRTGNPSKAYEGMVFGAFRSKTEAETCYDSLIARGFLPSEINVMMSDQTRAREFPVSTEKGSKAGSKMSEGAGVGGAIGTAVGATLAAIAAAGTSLVLPGLGLVVAGPIAAALAGGAAGGLAGGAIGGLVGLGFNDQDARKYNEVLASGGVILAVKADRHSAGDVKDLMVKAGGQEVAAF